MNTKNRITGGQRNISVAYVYCDGYDVHEISADVANGFGFSNTHTSFIIINLWQDEGEKEMLKRKCPHITEDAYRAILGANLRGVDVEIFMNAMKSKKFYGKAVDVYTNISNLPLKEWQKVQKIISQYGGSLA